MMEVFSYIVIGDVNSFLRVVMDEVFGNQKFGWESLASKGNKNNIFQ